MITTDSNQTLHGNRREYQNSGNMQTTVPSVKDGETQCVSKVYVAANAIQFRCYVIKGSCNTKMHTFSISVIFANNLSVL